MTDIVDPGLGSEPRIGRTGVLGAVGGFVACLLGIGVGGTLAGMEPAGAIGLGAFVGMWGGLGFGFMMGCTIPLARHMDRDQHDARADGG